MEGVSQYYMVLIIIVHLNIGCLESFLSFSKIPAISFIVSSPDVPPDVLMAHSPIVLLGLTHS